MLYLYLDESGDLGFDFFAKRPSKFFTVTVLAIHGVQHNRQMIKGVRKTLARKLSGQQRNELKGFKDSLSVKKYFYEQVSEIPFEIYSLTLNKKRVYNRLTSKKDRVYNFVTRQVVEKIPLERATNRVMLVVDKSKNKKEVREFNEYLVAQLEGQIDPKVPLDIMHHSSQQNVCLQAADLFSWGIRRKYEKNDTRWYEVFQAKVKFDEVYLP